jgi:hypothetical protein
MIRNTFAFAGPDWESRYLAHVRRQAHIAPKYHAQLIPLNYSVPVDSYQLGNLRGHEITVIAPRVSDMFRSGIAQYLLGVGADLVVTISDVGSLETYRSMT